MVPLWSSCSIDCPLVVRHFTWNHLSVHEISVLNRGYRKVDYMYINKCLCLIGWLIIPSEYYLIIMPSRISWWTLVSKQYNSQVFMLLGVFCFAVYTSNQTFLVGFWLYNQIIINHVFWNWPFYRSTTMCIFISLLRECSLLINWGPGQRFSLVAIHYFQV